MTLPKPDYHFNDMFICNILIDRKKKIAYMFYMSRLSKYFKIKTKIDDTILSQKSILPKSKCALYSITHIGE